MTKKISIQLSESNHAKLIALAERYGTESEAVGLAIHRLYEQEMVGQTYTPAELKLFLAYVHQFSIDDKAVAFHNAMACIRQRDPETLRKERLMCEDLLDDPDHKAGVWVYLDAIHEFDLGHA